MKNYNFFVKWSKKDAVYIARVKEFPSLACHGDSHDEALNEIKCLVKFIKSLDKGDENR
jgi:predicted RNase H-like HicB family nuclease